MKYVSLWQTFVTYIGEKTLTLILREIYLAYPSEPPPFSVQYQYDRSKNIGRQNKNGKTAIVETFYKGAQAKMQKGSQLSFINGDNITKLIKK
ncbi:hypothetical protein [Pleomorphovibrio marinus]|uniref:hypothetical protein n=1 Tax=Pleomorphovibrio marinus TaxID=2164132 RepID=UPI000E0A203D|nr:hypothetical protein [Pleomorphovibrio marinus]